MAKLEEILPEIRKGRRCRLNIQSKGGFQTLASLVRGLQDYNMLNWLLYDGWELEPIEEQKITITKEEFTEAYTRASRSSPVNRVSHTSLAIAIGFKE